MTKIVFFIIALTYTGSGVQAQLQLKTDSTISSKPAPSYQHPLAQSLADLVNALQPSAFINGAKDKQKMLLLIADVRNPADLGKNLSRLTGMLQAAKMNTTFKKDEFQKSALHTTTIQSAKGMLRDLEINLKNGSMNDIWRIQRNGWLEMLENIH